MLPRLRGHFEELTAEPLEGKAMTRMTRRINFNAGPAALPVAVLEQAQAEMLDYAGTGASMLEHSHRGPEYAHVHEEVMTLFAELLALPDSHAVVMTQGGGSLQFAMVPMNFLPPGGSADYLVTGYWARLAFEEARRIGTARAACDSAELKIQHLRLPTAKELSLDPKAAYVHLTSNNTLFGTQWNDWPDTGNVPLVADMSSDILSRPVDASRFKLIYAGAQKNLGPAGLAFTAVDKDWLASARKDLPDILRYEVHLKAKSIYHTPPTFLTYLVGLQLKWIKAHGGAAGMEKRNRTKAERLYGTLDRLAGFYRAPVEKGSRSLMNVVFHLSDTALDDVFVAEAAKRGIIGLKGHRNVGGMRVSLYNAVSPEDVDVLVAFLEDFARAKG
jgi:phosphoserine aminotransferase